MQSTASRYWKSLVSTEDLLAFARQRSLHLGRTNPKRTLNLYIRKGLLPPRVRTYQGRLNWGFPPYVKALLVLICRLKEKGRSLAEIKKIVEKEVEKSHEAFKQPDRTLSGLEDAFSDPVYDYNYHFCHREAKYALACLKEGKVREAEQTLKDLIAVLEPPTEGKRVLVVYGPRPLPAGVVAMAKASEVKRKGRKKATPQGRKQNKENM